MPLLCLYSQNNLRLFTGTGITFTAYLNDSVINKKPDVDVLVENLDEDTVTIKIEFSNKLQGKARLFLLDKKTHVTNKEFKYLADIKANKVKITFAGMEDILPLPSPLVPPKPIIDTSYKVNNNILGHFCELKEGKVIYYNNVPKSGDCVEVMPSIYTKYVDFLVGRAQTDDDRFLVAENTCQNNCFTVSQLNRILVHVPFEIEKLKLIRLAFFHVVDKENKQKLDSTFKLESSKRELQSFFKNAADYKYATGAKCSQSSTEEAINAFCEKLSVYSNDAERFIVFKKLYSELCYSTSQVKTVLLKFIHDREKLDAAKLLYYHCTEKDNFLSISDVFSYGTTVSELKDFVSKQK
jgi:hypothetical protein